MKTVVQDEWSLMTGSTACLSTSLITSHCGELYIMPRSAEREWSVGRCGTMPICLVATGQQSCPNIKLENDAKEEFGKGDTKVRR